MFDWTQELDSELSNQILLTIKHFLESIGVFFNAEMGKFFLLQPLYYLTDDLRMTSFRKLLVCF